MKEITVPLCRPFLASSEYEEIVKVISSGHIAEGPKTLEFEQMLARVFGRKYACACSNGTIAIYLMLKAAGIGEGCEVIVPNFTMIATANAVILAGARPVFADVDISGCLDPDDIESRITKKTKAIMTVPCYGQSPDMDRISAVAKASNLILLEDAAPGIGVLYNNMPVGSFGVAASLSFYADKAITTGEGGAILTDNIEIVDTVRKLKNQGRLSAGQYIHPTIGFNFRLADVLAAIGVAQLKKLDYIIEKRIKNFRHYLVRLSSASSLRFTHSFTYSRSVPSRINILVQDPQGLSDFLTTKGIGSRRFFMPLHLQPCYQNENKSLVRYDGKYQMSSSLYEEGLSLPSSTDITEQEIDYICHSIGEYFSMGFEMPVSVKGTKY